MVTDVSLLSRGLGHRRVNLMHPGCTSRSGGFASSKEEQDKHGLKEVDSTGPRDSGACSCLHSGPKQHITHSRVQQKVLLHSEALIISVCMPSERLHVNVSVLVTSISKIIAPMTPIQATFGA